MAVEKKKPATLAKLPEKALAKKSLASKIVVNKALAKSNPHSVSILKMSRPSFVTQMSGASERLSPQLQAVIDKTEISQVVVNLARSLDRADETLMRSTLHHDATVDFGPGMFQGTGNDYVHWALGVMHGIKSSHHMMGQIRIELEGEVALVESYLHAQFRVEKPIGREDIFIGGRYLDRMERRPAGASGVWKISHRKQIIDWVRTEAASDIFYHHNPDALWSTRTKTDPSLHMANFPGSQSGGKLPAFLGRRYDSKSIKF